MSGKLPEMELKDQPRVVEYIPFQHSLQVEDSGAPVKVQNHRLVAVLSKVNEVLVDSIL